MSEAVAMGLYAVKESLLQQSARVHLEKDN